MLWISDCFHERVREVEKHPTTGFDIYNTCIIYIYIYIFIIIIIICIYLNMMISLHIYIYRHVFVYSIHSLLTMHIHTYRRLCMLTCMRLIVVSWRRQSGPRVSLCQWVSANTGIERGKINDLVWRFFQSTRDCIHLACVMKCQ